MNRLLAHFCNSEENCSTHAVRLGYCETHYACLRATGTPYIESWDKSINGRSTPNKARLN